ncbi:PREDICTED: integumentary mucin C.1-like isoform X4 [Acropora digitifera]|uniref:integumentary mucin C.1-like isoform X4 n=1 Tax=Acropora digitifera TaxID=70779 RepID=UPI00077A79BE|nr:PREDICTED: integumentary mucin C.1-like isoform X4 [Acropora digitifera]
MCAPAPVLMVLLGSVFGVLVLVCFLVFPLGKICLRMELYGCSNPLTTTTAPTTQSAPNKTTPPTTTTTAPTSTEKLMMNHSATAPSALRTKLLLTTLRVANNEAPENYSPATRATNASSTEKPTIICSATGTKGEVKKGSLDCVHFLGSSPMDRHQRLREHIQLWCPVASNVGVLGPSGFPR